MCKFIKKKKRGKMLRKPRRKLIYTMPFSSPETKKAYEKNISVEVVYWMNEDVFQKTLSFINSFYEEIYEREFDISTIERPDPNLGYSTGLLIADWNPPVIFTKWGAIRFPFFEHMGMSKIASIDKVKNAILKLGLYKTYRSTGFFVCRELPGSRLVPSWERDKNHVARLAAWDIMLEETLERSYIEQTELTYQYS